ncbi:MAG: Spermidine N(1)-acetyltransferase [Chlamydiae bacterium]|nr:Spermidine N(1)-acetyltransferase [Chlamydiota bacterium]
MPAPILKTKRLILRPWKPEDLPLFAKINTDERVMDYFPSTLSTEESDAFAQRIQDQFKKKNYGLWAVEVPGVAPFIGFVGLIDHDFPAHFTPCIEIGWRLAFDYWGKGYAFEAAAKVMDYAFNELNIEELVSMTAVLNHRSQKLMEKLGMTRDPKDDFEHPNLDLGHPLRPHVLYRKSHTT